MEFIMDKATGGTIGLRCLIEAFHQIRKRPPEPVAVTIGSGGL
jgi:hypothetical protein